MDVRKSKTEASEIVDNYEDNFEADEERQQLMDEVID